MRKWLLASVLAFLTLAGAGVFSIILYLRKNFPPEKIQLELETQLSRRSGFDVRIAEVDFSWSGGVKVGRVCARNAQMTSDRCFVLAEKITLDVAMLPLINKRLELRAARVGSLAFNLFEETLISKGGAKTVLHSWDAQKSAVTETSASAELPALTIGAIDVDRGEVVRDVSLPPFTVGKTRFTLRYRQDKVSVVDATVLYSPEGEAKLSLTAQGENFVAAILQLIRKRQLPAGARFEVKLECRACPLEPLDSRLKYLTGNAEVSLTDADLLIEMNNTVLGITSPVSGDFRTAARLPIRLTDLSLINADIKLEKPGLSLHLGRVNWGKTTTGLSAQFNAMAELSALGLGPGITGNLSGGGQILRGLPSATFTVTHFTYPLRQKIILTAQRLSLGMNGETLSLNGQAFKLNNSAFTATATLRRSGSLTRVSGSVLFPQLDLSVLADSAAEKPQNDAAITQGAKTDIALKIVIGELSAGKWQASQFRGEMFVNGTGLQLENASAALAHGKIQFAYRRPVTGSQSLRLQAQGLKAQVISENFELPGTVYGMLNTTANLQFTGDTSEAIRRNLTGNLSADLGRGKIKNSFLQKGILTGPLHKLEEKFSDIEFASGSVEARFSAGAIEIKKLFFDAEEWNAQLRAEADREGQGKAALNFRFRSSFVENAANPLHLGIGSRKDGDFYDLPFACRGNVFSGSCYKANW